MIEQLWYTWSTVGLGNVTGFRVRAASSGLADIRSERFRVLERHLHYDLPVGVDPYEATTENSPYCLSLLDVADTRILVHKVYIGKDGYGRPGVHFIHLLEGLPHTFLAHNAIQLWQSPFWQQSDSDLSTASCELEQIASTRELSAGSLDRHDLKPLEQELQFIIQAYLCLQPQQKLYIAAAPEQVAALIWGLTCSLPPALQQRLTFSTYERDVHDVDALVVGTCWSPDIQYDLPVECYEKQGLALNCYSGKRSLPESTTLVAAYARFATGCLISNNRQRQDELLHIADEMAISDAGSLLVLYELFTAKSLSRERMTKLLETFELAAGLLTQEGIQNSIFQLVRDDPQHWWDEHGKQAIAVLRTRKHNERGMSVVPGLNSLAERAATRAASELLSGDRETCVACLFVLFEAAPTNSNPDPWLHLLNSFTSSIEMGAFRPSEMKDWELQAWLLKNWASAAPHTDTQLILPWLQVSWEKLQPLLALTLPANWYTLSIVDLLTRSADLIPPSITAIVINKQTLFDEALRYLMQDAPQVALGFFAKLVSYGYREKISMLSVLLAADNQGDAIAPLLQAARLSDKEQVYLFKQHAQLFLALHSFPEEILGLIAAYLSSLTDQNLSDASNLQLLQRLQNSAAKLQQDYVHTIRDWKIAAEAISEEKGVSALQFDGAFLAILANALHNFQLYNKEPYMKKLYTALIKNIHTDEQLHNVVKALAPALGITPYTFLHHLAAYRGSMYNNSISHRFLLLYIALACEYASDSQSPSQEQFLLPTLRALLKNVERRDFDKIDQEAEGWAPTLRRQWRVCSAGLRPTTIMTRIGDSVTNLLPSRKPKNSVATVNGKEILYEWFEQVYKLQNLYIPVRVGELNAILGRQTDQSWLRDERGFLQELPVPHTGREKTLTMLENDVIIMGELGRIIQKEKSIEVEIEKELQDVFQDLKRQKGDISKAGQFTNEDVKDVLGVFLRYRTLAQYLWSRENQTLIKTWLEGQRRRAKIKYNKDISSILQEQQ